MLEVKARNPVLIRVAQPLKYKGHSLQNPTLSNFIYEKKLACQLYIIVTTIRETIQNHMSPRQRNILEFYQFVYALRRTGSHGNDISPWVQAA